MKQAAFDKQELEFFEELIREAFATKRESFLMHLRSRVQQCCLERADVVDNGDISPTDEEWICISSLSQLRAAVGGRFQNLRTRWLEAGFPLKEHKGDRTTEFELDEDGWVELTNWVSKQSYEIRLLKNGGKGFFEIRKL